MGYRVDLVQVKIVVNEEFEGSHVVQFSWSPEHKFDSDLEPLIKALFAKNDELLRTQIAAGTPGQIDLFM